MSGTVVHDEVVPARAPWSGVVAAGHTLRMAPPLTLTEAEAKEGLSILTDAFTAVNEEATAT